MPAAYDTYNYPNYWEEREYEHKSELIALKFLFGKIKKIRTLVDIGSGFGRLTSVYLHRSKKIILVDPSAKLLKIARQKHKSKKITYIHSTAENLSAKLNKNSADLVLLVRVVHHLHNMDDALATVDKICKKGGYLILEYPNKRHLKAIFSEILNGNFTYALDIFPRDRRSKKSIKKNDLPFMNYHPDFIKDKLKKYGFRVEHSISVSHLRSIYFKNHIPLDALLWMESLLQKYFSWAFLTPSVFILAKKIN